MNSNAVHNILNFASLALAMLTAGLLAIGCVAVATGFDCGHSWLMQYVSPEVTAIAIGVAQALKLGINFFRDGPGGMFKPQPPVQK